MSRTLQTRTAALLAHVLLCSLIVTLSGVLDAPARKPAVAVPGRAAAPA